MSADRQAGNWNVALVLKSRRDWSSLCVLMGTGAKGWEAALPYGEQSKAWCLQEGGHRKPRDTCPAQHLCQVVLAFSSPRTEQAAGCSRPLTHVSPCSQPSRPREALGLRLLLPRLHLSPRFPFSRSALY